jgi:NADPH:quinone reductase-like Zn-dependent oxidoreductase
MKALLLQHYGGLDALQIGEVPTPPLNPDEVLVKVKAMTISPLELKIRSGQAKMFVRRKLPMILGADFAGAIAQVGPNVTTFKSGDSVIGMIDPFKQAGPYAEYVVASASQLIHKPVQLSDEQACALPIAGISALQSLRDLGKLQSGQHVLILGAAGALGHLGVQIAHQMGAKVTAVCSASNLDFVKSLEADDAIDYNQQNPFEKTDTYDLIFDSVDKYTFGEAKAALRKGGIFVNTVPGPAKMLSTLGNPFRSKKLTLLMMKPNFNDVEYIVNQVAEQKLKVHIDKVYEGLESIPEATAYLEKGHVRGKLVIKLP